MHFFNTVSPVGCSFALEIIKNPWLILAVFVNTVFQNSWPVRIQSSFSLICFLVNQEPACLSEAAGFMQNLWWNCWWNNCSAMLERVNSEEVMSQGTKKFCYCMSSISSEEMIALYSREMKRSLGVMVRDKKVSERVLWILELLGEFWSHTGCC